MGWGLTVGFGVGQHVQSVHPPTVRCACGGQYVPSERKKHFRESTSHPSCFVCGDGFAAEFDLEQVMSCTGVLSRPLYAC